MYNNMNVIWASPRTTSAPNYVSQFPNVDSKRFFPLQHPGNRRPAVYDFGLSLPIGFYCHQVVMTFVFLIDPSQGLQANDQTPERDPERDHALPALLSYLHHPVCETHNSKYELHTTRTRIGS
jgi:hypothetical protein